MSQTERIFHIARLLGNGRKTTARGIAEKFEVSARQVKRDIEYLRDRLGAPIVWDVARQSYRYSQEWHGLDFADETTFLTFAFLKAILDQYMYVPIISGETVSLLREKLGSHYEPIAAKVRYELPDMEKIDGETAYALCDSLLNGTAITITYTDAKGGKKNRKIAPLRIINYSGKWYCVAFDSNSGEMRTFALSRMEDVRSGELPDFVVPSKDEIEKFVSESYGIFKGPSVGTATLRFHDGAARYISVQTWHKDQVLETGKDMEDPDAMDLSLPVHDWTELLGRALRCGSQCEVMAPPEFRDRWVREIEKLGELAHRPVAR